jgi:hypothetical protein
VDRDGESEAAMKINGEEVELVTDFASLRSGMTVFVNPCASCIRHHRGMLLGLKDHPGFERHYEVVPFPKCVNRKHWLYAAVAPDHVRERRLYRVVDPLLDARPVTRAKELAR